jgi:hypothetical protein
MRHQKLDNISSSDLSLQRRRRFVKAVSFTLPAVMTMYHGSVLALSSAVNRCLVARQHGDKSEGLMKAGQSDSALPSPYHATTEETVCHSVTIREYKFCDDTVNNNPFIEGSTIQFYLDHKRWKGWRYPDGTSTGSVTEEELDEHVRENFGEFCDSGNTTSIGGYMGGDYCAVAQVNDEGWMRDSGQQDPNFMPVSQSCWISFQNG